MQAVLLGKGSDGMGNLTFIDLFAGIGGFRRGMELAGHKCIGFCEYDNFAVASYTSMHCITEEQRQYLSTLSLKDRQKEILKPEYRNGEWYAKDIREVKGSNIPRADVWGFGAPCFVAGTLITTQRGQIPIEEVKVGDMVLTHKSRWQRVEETMNHKATGIYTIQVQGSPKTEVTGNHRFYVRYCHTDGNWTKPEWKEVQHFIGNEYVIIPNIDNQPNWQLISEISFDPNRNEIVYNLEVENDHSYTANNMGVHNCQDFSIAGIRKGLDGDRSSLIREVYRIISEIPEADRPKYLVYENVKGMLSSNGGWDYAAILIEMAELGYDVYFQNFNSKYYGVPQNRERIYTIGCLRTKCSEKVFSFSGSDEKDNLEGMNPKCLGGFGEQNSNGGTQFYQQDRIYDSHTVATSLTNDLPGGSNYYTIDVDSSNQIGHIETENRDNPQRHRVYDVNKAGPTLNTYGGGGQLPEIPVKVDLGDSKQQIIPMNQDC